MKSYSLEQLKKMSNDNPIIAFDGVCNLCNGFIQWLIKRDKKKLFRYTTLQSESGETLSQSIEIDGDSVLLFHKEKMYALSDVGLKCMRILGGFWTPLSWLIYLPKAIRDSVYKFIAKNRYKWFGKAAACMIPDASIRALFL